MLLKAKSSKPKALHGFTLIEMLVVVAIISILAGIVLTGVTGFQANARDTRRISDLAQVRNYLEIYFNKHGHYPGDVDGAITTTANSWESMTDALADSGVTVPNDPLSANLASRTYYYSVQVSPAENLTYIIGAKLERDNNVLDRVGEIDDVDTTEFAGGTATSTVCDDTSPAFGYCIGS